MSIIGSYNGASIIAFPDKPAPRQIELGMNDMVAVSSSPFTGSTQAQAWPGADLWDASIALPKLTAEDAAVWSAFFGECRGRLNVFYLADPTYTGPRGTVKGSPVVSGVNNAMAIALNTKGWTPSSFRLLLPGDYLQLGNRLHRVLDQVNSDTNGDATISIWPSIREATTDGQAVILNNPKGLFRLASNRRSVLTDETRLSGVSIKAVEAR
jgi:hypothetical protein